jgi:predicted nucleotidyltransferase
VADALVDALRRNLAGHPSVKLAILFGSTARGNAGPASDVDVAVIAHVDHLALARDLSRAVDREVQIVDLATVGYPLLQAIVRDGIVVAESERGVSARWRARALAELDTDRVWFERMRDAYLARLGGRESA